MKGDAMGNSKNAPDSSERQREIAMRFERAVFLIGVGLRDKEIACERNPHAYPYSENFRHGLGIFAALAAEFGEDESSLATLNESGFIREQCGMDVRSWADGWSKEAREAVHSCKYADYGPLAAVDDGFFSRTDDCIDLVIYAEDDVLGGFQERRVYEYLRAGTQEQYVLGRAFLLQHPLLSWNEYHNLKAGVLDLGGESFGEGEACTVEMEWMSGLAELAFEKPPDGARVCPHCGWTMTLRGMQPSCSSPACIDPIPDFLSLGKVSRESMRLNRGVMRYIAGPGALENRIAEAASNVGLAYEMWPQKDLCDVLVTLPDGTTLALDAKDYCNPVRLGRQIGSDCMRELLDVDEGLYVVPDETARRHPGFVAVCNNALSGKPGYSCVTFSALCRRMKEATAGGCKHA